MAKSTVTSAVTSAVMWYAAACLIECTTVVLMMRVMSLSFSRGWISALTVADSL